VSNEIVGKQLTYVELDLDVYRVTRLEAARAGEPIANWSNQWDTDTTMLGVVDTALPSGRGARIAKTVSGDNTFWRWDIPPALAGASAVALFRASNAGTSCGILLRASGADGSENGYYFAFATDRIRLFKFAAGAVTMLAELLMTLDMTQFWWMRFDAVTIAGPGVLLRGKVWQGELSNEPSLFTLFAEDASSPITAAAGCGINVFDVGHHVDVGHFRVRSLFGSEIETIRHAMPTDYLPLQDVPAIPDVVAAAFNPAMISLGSDLGVARRAILTPVRG